ncbi:predicted protein [Lichtheimia corymbifera JMRC:FSU:9682]|uniref:Uncharacterized protein n=1 Tax=Lichtheimia corymbifera JMRC:FSU:9682 TaxID=1263082 RepID=A0A068SED2_9FUNG|nr:predicted protein [Lichtheimia corymbifera JMRC:FSU:9682]
MEHGGVTRTKLIGMMKTTICQSFKNQPPNLKFTDFDVSQKVSRGRPDFILAAGKTTNFEIGHMNAEILTQDTFGDADHLCSTDHSMLHSQVLR